MHGNMIQTQHTHGYKKTVDVCGQEAVMNICLHTTCVMMWYTITIHCITGTSDVSFISIKRGPLLYSLIETAYLAEVN